MSVGAFPYQGFPHHGGTVLRSRCSPHLAGAPIAPWVLDLRAVKHHRNSSVQRQITGRPTSRPCLNSTLSQRCDIDGRPCRACSYWLSPLTLLASCAAHGNIGDYIPHWAGGLPEATPPRPGTPDYDAFRQKQNVEAARDKSKDPPSEKHSADCPIAPCQKP